MTPKPIDWVKVEKLRQHMRLSQGELAQLLGVSRVTYYNWTRGKPVRENNARKARACVRRLIAIVQGGWPTPEISAMDSETRMRRLVALMNAA